jgi:hypothetical protein
MGGYELLKRVFKEHYEVREEGVKALEKEKIIAKRAKDYGLMRTEPA